MKTVAIDAQIAPELTNIKQVYALICDTSAGKHRNFPVPTALTELTTKDSLASTSKADIETS